MKKQLISLLLVTGLVFFAGCSEDSSDTNTENTIAYTGNAVTDFSNTNNPNGAWSYGEMTTSFTDFLLLSEMDNDGLGGWSNNSVIYINSSDAVRYSIQPGELVLHPGSGELPAVLRWTASETGTYSVIGEFGAGDSGFLQVGVRKDNDFLFQAPDSGAFDLNVSVVEDETIDFVVYGGYSYGSTSLSLQISKTN